MPSEQCTVQQPAADQRGRWIAAALPAAVAGAGLIYLYNHAPYAGASLLPPCPLQALTGLSCPFCGVTRMTYALLPGDVAAAWSLNAIVLLALPVVLSVLLWQGRQARAYGGGQRGWKRRAATRRPGPPSSCFSS